MSILLFLDTCLPRYEGILAVEKCKCTTNAGMGGLSVSCFAMFDRRLWFFLFFFFYYFFFCSRCLI